MNKFGKHTIIAIILLLVTLFIGCNADESPMLETGSLLISLNKKGMQRSLWIPELNMEIHSYKITGEGPRGSNFVIENFEGENLSKENLKVGKWQIDVEGYNESKIKIAGSESLIVTIAPNKKTTATAVLSPIVGVICSPKS